MHKDVRKQLGSKVREWRLRRGISQERLAALASLHRTYVGAVERGERNVSLVNIVVIARALGVLPSKLLEDVQ